MCEEAAGREVSGCFETVVSAAPKYSAGSTLFPPLSGAFMVKGLEGYGLGIRVWGLGLRVSGFRA